MNEKIFEQLMIEQTEGIGVKINKTQLEKFYNYMALLLEWNKKINLTAIVKEEEIITKHFIDSLTILKNIKETDKIIDVGTGAGFPGIPIRIMLAKAEITLIDALNKRITFLEECSKKLKLKELNIIHGRAEETAHDDNYREEYDIVVSRAVSPLNILLEYSMPFLKQNGLCICMKGKKAVEELKTSEKTIKKLGCELIEINKINLKGNLERNLVVIKKIEKTKELYPRQFAKIKKNPL